MKTTDEIYEYIRERVDDTIGAMDEWGFSDEDMDEWSRGNYAAYKHLLAWITGEK